MNCEEEFLITKGPLRREGSGRIRVGCGYGCRSDIIELKFVRNVYNYEEEFLIILLVLSTGPGNTGYPTQLDQKKYLLEWGWALMVHSRVWYRLL